MNSRWAPDCRTAPPCRPWWRRSERWPRIRRRRCCCWAKRVREKNSSRASFITTEQRSAAPFIGVNCTAIPRELFESELFGYERGAFTGAHHRKFGLLDRAEGGTLFLDEIGDLDLAMQAKLLRVLQERTVQRVGGTEDIAVRLSVDRCDES